MALEARSINLSIDDFLHICRLCGKENNQLSSLYQQITNEKILIEAVKEYFGVNAHIGDGLPEKVCNLCISKINDFLDFIRNCLQTQEMLQKILNGSSSNKTNEENSVSRLGNDKSSEFIDIGLSYIKTEIKTETYDDFTVSDPSNEVNELKPESNPLESTCDPAEHSAPANSSSPNNDGYLVTLEHSAPANSSSTNTEAPVREKRKRVTRLENLNDGYLHTPDESNCPESMCGPTDHSVPANSSSLKNTKALVREKRKRIARLGTLNDEYLAQADDPTKPEKIKPTPPTKKLKASQKDLFSPGGPPYTLMPALKEFLPAGNEAGHKRSVRSSIHQCRADSHCVSISEKLATCSEDELILMGLGLVVADATLNAKKERKPRLKWSKEWLKERESSKSHISLMNELSVEPQDWRNYLRMDEQTYEQLLQYVSPYIEKEDTVMRKAITPNERLSATLRFLATGQSYEDLKFSTRISPQSLGKIIPETCRSIRKALTKDFMKFPSTEEEWLKIAHTFEAKWNFPNCLGAVDGKHVKISTKATDGAYFRNYKGFDSMVLIGIVDANYEFVMCDFGINGRISDGGVIKETSFYNKLVNNHLNIPPPSTVNNSVLPFVFIGDEAFELRNDFLTPFRQRELNHERKIFNYRLSRPRNVVENAFGILASRFRVLHSSLNVKYTSCEEIVMACCVLHNFLRRTKKEDYTDLPSELDDDAISLVPLDRGHARHTSEANLNTRELFKQYFCNEGALSSQEDIIANNYY